MATPQPINHPLHIVLSILTGGFWLFVYAWVLITRKQNCQYTR